MVANHHHYRRLDAQEAAREREVKVGLVQHLVGGLAGGHRGSLARSVAPQNSVTSKKVSTDIA